MNIHLSYLLGGFFLLLSCNNEELVQEYEKDVPIRFRSLCVEISTKSTTNNSLLRDSQISLFSIQHLPNSLASNWNPKLFENTMGICDMEGNILYDNTYFFPAGNELDFFAVHPFISSATTGFDYDGTQYTTVTLKDNATDQYDLMYASLLNQSKKSSVLVFEFHHLLTQITINIIKNTGVTIDLPLTKVQIAAPQSATLDIWQGQLSDITGQTTYTLDTNTTLSDGDNPISGQFLLFPQKANEMILTFGNDESNVFHVALSDEPRTWEAGVNYQYDITINRNIPEITSPEVPVDDNVTPNEKVNNGGEIPETPTDSTATDPQTKASGPNPYHIHLSID
ncbi:fimbrillin family protein [Parabacteroides distasonis]|uniref:fimbrillin family protein n=1 Tax=Parabacteroides distasonis TaxID=823 RepID=UPI0018A09821|nr:fimbrillin family protein [Parabacteroides distasonis]MDB9152273.1 fimbrillin family protein [Parabacteroides distasonis]MDB9156829.1 fimbrillin family protein [Parabacteroides distasonis]MDB9165529.1 fimbrillin family protein [Parabacteroides distasonis]MDB9170361.1 fimbrillin family protein [Parabacteroides distasonis]MDB9193511.1 fimbrillin family protein [Parabacteroides distasonis]